MTKGANYQYIVFRKEKGVATLVMNRPERRNAFNSQMVEEMNSALAEVRADDSLRVLVLTGAGNAFCSGADFRYREVREGKVPVTEAEEPRIKIGSGLMQGRFLHAVTDFILGLRQLDKPTIAMVGGDAVGAGFDLALACDMRFGSSQARFLVGFTRLGLPPDTGTAWFLPRITSINNALEIIMSGDFVSAEDAYRLGILNRVVPPEKLEAETLAFSRKLAKGPPIAHRLSKTLLYHGLSQDLEAALIQAMAFVAVALNTSDHLEGVKAFAEKRPPVFQGK